MTRYSGHRDWRDQRAVNVRTRMAAKPWLWSGSRDCDPDRRDDRCYGDRAMDDTTRGRWAPHSHGG